MKKRAYSDVNFFPNRQEKLFLYEAYFDLFIKLYNKNLLSKKILLTGQVGLGKSTFAYHLINFVLSYNENFPYDIKNYKINPRNKSFRLINQNCHPNFFLIDNFSDTQIIDIAQIRNMITYANHTTYRENIKFILVNNTEYLSQQSVNALLKIVEEPTFNTFFIFIHNSSHALMPTLKSRCVEFRIFFTNDQQKKILANLLLEHDLKFETKLFNEITTYYDSPGTLLNIAKLLKEDVIGENELNLIDIIERLMELNLKSKNNLNLHLLQYFIELFYFKKIRTVSNKNKIFFNYSKAITQFNLFKKYNIDMNNVFYELKENIIHA